MAVPHPGSFVFGSAPERIRIERSDWLHHQLSANGPNRETDKLPMFENKQTDFKEK
jgi:hypothetical protein